MAGTIAAGDRWRRIVSWISRGCRAEIIKAGFWDLAEERSTEVADLVLIGAPRLSRLGLDVPLDRSDGAEHRLYQRLAAEDSRTARARYNALIRRLVSFERAAECMR